MDVDTLVAAMPGLSRSDAQRHLAPMEAAMREYGVTNEMRARMWLAQVGHESGSLVYFEEIADGSAYEGRADLGNTQPGDGKKYKGRGPIQVTGRYNYTEAGGALNLPLVDQPHLAADPATHSFRISAWWWQTHGLNEISDTGDVVAATRRINGGTNGLDDRQRRYELARQLGAKVIPAGGSGAAPPSSGKPVLHVDYLGKNHNSTHPDVRVWQQKMASWGWFTQGQVDGVFGPQSESVARRFQEQQGLTQDGLVGSGTWAKTFP